MIRTPDHRLRVFVSSTLGELADERAAAREAIQRMRLSPVMFELGARAHPPRDLYRSYLDQSDVFVGIYWQRYGWTAPDMTVSGLEDEYLLSGTKPRLLYIKEPAPAREGTLKSLLSRIEGENQACYKRFSSPAQLQELLENDVALLLTERFVDAADPATEPLRIDNLPAIRTTIVGRTTEVTAVREALTRDQAGVVTLTGSGGAGKTTIAIAAATALAAAFDHGVCFVDLSSVHDPALVGAAIARALGLAESPGRSADERLLDGLRHRHLLLVLDNFEQVVRAARLLTDLLATCARLRVLVTSRQPLNVRGERELVISPLLPSDASRLFIERARQLKPEFASGAGEEDQVAEICRRLDGVPLAIELAAARARVLTPHAMLARIDKRLSLLTGGAQDLPERQKTMRAAIDWSHELLDPAERLLYRQVAAFTGSFNLEAAEAVVAGPPDVDVLEGISSLVSKSLLRAGDADGEPRFSMLAIVHEHALDELAKSGDAAAVAERHARYFEGFARSGEPRMTTRERPRWLARLEADVENLRAAFDWGLANDPALSLEMCLALAWFWYQTGRPIEGRTRTMAALEAGARRNVDETLVARATCVMGMISLANNQGPSGRAALDKARTMLAASGDDVWLGRATTFAGLAAMLTGDPAGAIAHCDAARPILRRAGERWYEGQSLLFAAEALLSTGDRVGARARYDEALALYDQIGDPWGRTNILSGLSDLAAYGEDFPTARARAEEAAALARQHTDMFALARSLSASGNAATAMGDYAAGESSLREALVIWRMFGVDPMVWSSLVGLAVTAVGAGRLDQARALYAPVRHLVLAPGVPLMSGGPVYVKRFVAALDAALGDVLAAGTVAEAVETVERGRRS